MKRSSLFASSFSISPRYACTGALVFLLLHALLGGLRWDHALGAGLFVLGSGLKNRSQAFFVFFLPLFLMLALYDLQGYFAEELRSRSVELRIPQEFDRTWLGMDHQGEVLTPAAWWQQHTHPVLDFLTGGIYLTFVPAYLLIALWFRFGAGSSNSPEGAEARRMSHCLMWGMLLLNLICCATYYLYPAAPPWYLDEYGSGPVVLDAPPDPAGGARFDTLLGISFYADYYSRVPNIFGAVPSIHAAFPLFTLYFAFRLKALRVFSLFYFLAICFSAIYLNHHFVFDLLWGSGYALALALALDAVSYRQPVFSSALPAVQPETTA